MGVNLGAFIGPLVCGWLATTYGWHYGFGAAGVGMVLGLIQFKLFRRLLGNAGTQRGNPNPLHPVERFGLGGGVIAVVLTAALGMAGVITLNLVRLRKAWPTSFSPSPFCISPTCFCFRSETNWRRSGGGDSCVVPGFGVVLGGI